MAELDALYAELWSAHGDAFGTLDRSLAPRSWELLFDVMGAAGFGPESIVADVGCGRGNHCEEFDRRFGCRAVGIDRVLQPMQAATLSDAHLSAAEFLQGEIEALPLQEGSVDFVWCRDMLVHVRNPEAAMRECFRILRHGGKMLAWVTTQTDLMEKLEAERLYAPLAIYPDSVSRRQLEASFENAGFSVLQHEELGSELIEFYEERDGRASRELMRIARMRRRREELIASGVRHDTRRLTLYITG